MPYSDGYRKISDIMIVSDRKAFFGGWQGQTGGETGTKERVGQRVKEAPTPLKPIQDNYLERLKEIARHNPLGILLRREDMAEGAYLELAAALMDYCRQIETLFITDDLAVAEQLLAPAVCVPFGVLKKMKGPIKKQFFILGCLCKAEEAAAAVKEGATFLLIDGVFESHHGMAGLQKALAAAKGQGKSPEKQNSSKRPHGEEKGEAASISVYAMGGISPSNVAEVRGAGADGAAVKEEAMTAVDFGAYLEALEKR